MSKTKKLSSKIPATEHEFDVEVEGEVTKQSYSGAFKARIPTIKMRAQADKRRAQLNAGLEENLDPTVRAFHYMISYLRTTLDVYPEWWRDSDFGYDLYDANVIQKVYDEVMTFENAWLAEIWGEKVGKAKAKRK